MIIIDVITNSALLLAAITIIYQMRVIRRLREANCTRAEELLTGYTELNGYTVPAPDHPGWEVAGIGFRNGPVELSAYSVWVRDEIIASGAAAINYINAVKRHILSATVTKETP